jgi:type 1 glutamine amidotransferase
MGTIPDQEPEPVFWINDNGKNKVIYTSLGHWDDWAEEGFRKLMTNSVRYLLGKEISKYDNDEETDLYK